MTQDPAVTIHQNIPRPAADIIKKFEVPTGYIADVQGRRGALDCGIKPLFDFPTIAGPAVTVQTVPNDNLVVFAAMGTVKPGDILVIATDNWTGSAVMGDLVAAMFKNSGIAGVVTDGVVRDLAGISAVGLPVYARGLTANSSQKNGPGTIGAEITMGGVIVRPGDILVGDRDGIAVLAREKIPQAIEGIETLRKRERAIEERIAAGMNMPDWVKEFLAGDRVKIIE